jgi:hypothetical protein
LSFKYRNRYFEDGDAVDPRDWTHNIANYTEEFNGYLNRDNLPLNGISTDMLVSESCTSVYSQLLQTQASIALDNAGWQEDDGTTSFNKLEFSAATDGLLTVEWSGAFTVPTTHGSDVWPSTVNLGDWFLTLRILVDGIEVCHIPRCINYFTKSAEYMVGTIPLAAGVHTVSLQARARLTDVESPIINDSGVLLTNSLILKNRELIGIYRKR